MRLTPWLQRIAHSDDLDFQEALIEYVASLNDAHDNIAFPTTFSASLGMTLDIYDGKVLIDSINRIRLPIADFPFVIGDEVISLDGRPVQEIIQSFRKYAISANQRSTDRIAAARLVSRSQQIMPHIAAARRHGDGHHPSGGDGRHQHLHDCVAEERHPDAVAGAAAGSRPRQRTDVPVDGRTGHHRRPSRERRRERRRSSRSPTRRRLTTRCRPTWSRSGRSSTPASPRTTTPCSASAAASPSSRCRRASPI